MAFQEPIDPLIEKLQTLINDLKHNISYNEFEDILTKIDKEFPFVDLSEFLTQYVHGESTKVLIERFHLTGYSDYYKLLQILKIQRSSIQKKSDSTKINLRNNKNVRRYEFLQEILKKFQSLIKNKIEYNVLRAIVIFQLYSNGEKFTNKNEIINSLSNTIHDFEHLILAPHPPIIVTNNKQNYNLINSILIELNDKSFLELDNENNFRLENHQLLISDYIFNIIRNRKRGITYQDLVILLKKKFSILSLIPSALIDVILYGFISNNKIIKKEGYRKQKPFFDQYFTFNNYRNLEIENVELGKKNREFFGRRITPDEFINELVELEKGDFEDQDDQITRIAGMVLANSNMMSHPPNELKEFDFVIDLSSYEFTKEQQKVMKNLNLEIKSNIIYIKVMINEEIKITEITELILKLQERKLDEQGIIVSFGHTGKAIAQMLKKNKIIQIISEKDLREWCKITPVIPARRGAVAVVRQRHHRGNIVKIKSVNYESGMADTILFPKMEEKTRHIGTLEEITISTSVEKFADYSDKYFQFLRKLYKISKTDIFRVIVTDEAFAVSGFRKIPEIIITLDGEIKCNFDESLKTKINLMKHINKTSLIYNTDDLFSCTCIQWNQKNRQNGLCEHLIFTLNKSIKKILSEKNELIDIDIELQLQKIEQIMDLFLNRLKYSNRDRTMHAKCMHCGKTAYTLKEVKDVFGYRQMVKEDKFSLRRQARCKKCR